MYLELLDVEDHENDHVLATVDVTDDEGTTVRTAYVFPKDTLEWRAAEYGIDPADTATLLDIVLFEPHVQIEPEKHLYAAESVDEARGHLLERVRERKAESEQQRPAGRRALAKGERPVHDRLVDLCHIDPQVIAVKQEMVGLQRIKSRQRARQERSTSARTAKFQGILKEMKQNATDADHAARARKA